MRVFRARASAGRISERDFERLRPQTRRSLGASALHSMRPNCRGSSYSRTPSFNVKRRASLGAAGAGRAVHQQLSGHAEMHRERFPDRASITMNLPRRWTLWMVRPASRAASLVRLPGVTNREVNRADTIRRPPNARERPDHGFDFRNSGMNGSH